jgi:hypothetical protein
LNPIKETENLNNKYQPLQNQMHFFKEKFKELIQQLEEDKRRKILEGSTSTRYRLLENRIGILEQCMENTVKLYQDSKNQQAQDIETISTLSQNIEKLRDRVNILKRRFSQAIQDIKYKNKKEHKIIGANFKNITRSIEISNKTSEKYYTQLAPRSSLNKLTEKLGNKALTSAITDKLKIEQKAFISKERFSKYESLAMLSRDRTNYIGDTEMIMNPIRKELSNAIPLVSGPSNLINPSYQNDTSNSASEHKGKRIVGSLKNNQ